MEILFKRLIFAAQSRPELKLKLLVFWDKMADGDSLRIDWISESKPKYREAVQQSLKELYQARWIDAMWSEDMMVLTKFKL